MAGSLDRPGQPHAPDDRPTPDHMPGQLRSPSPPPERLPTPDRPDAARPADRAAATDEPVPWSRADLEQRLERLPAGHPSSPHSPGLSRDQPPGLRDLDSLSPGQKTEQDHGGHPDDPDRQPDAVKGDYWGELPRFLRAWADHVCRWPAEQVAAAVDRSRDPAGSWRGDGNQYLNPEQHAQAKDEIARVQRTEKTLTEHMTEIQRENACGGWLEGIKFKLKGEDRLKEKLAEKIEHEPDRTPAQMVRQINDAIRYTFCFKTANYADGYRDVKQRLESHECRMVYSENHWHDDPEYKGINTRWVTPEGQRFEVQFHTSESYDAKQQVTHASYERLRNPLTHDDERQELRAFQRDGCYWITVPEGVADIADYPPERPQFDAR